MTLQPQRAAVPGARRVLPAPQPCCKRLRIPPTRRARRRLASYRQQPRCRYSEAEPEVLPALCAPNLHQDLRFRAPHTVGAARSARINSATAPRTRPVPGPPAPEPQSESVCRGAGSAPVVVRPGHPERQWRRSYRAPPTCTPSPDAVRWRILRRRWRRTRPRRDWSAAPKITPRGVRRSPVAR